MSSSQSQKSKAAWTAISISVGAKPCGVSVPSFRAAPLRSASSFPLSHTRISTFLHVSHATFVGSSTGFHCMRHGRPERSTAFMGKGASVAPPPDWTTKEDQIRLSRKSFAASRRAPVPNIGSPGKGLEEPSSIHVLRWTHTVEAGLSTGIVFVVYATI